LFNPVTKEAEDKKRMCADAEDGNVPVFGPGLFQGFFIVRTDYVIITSRHKGSFQSGRVRGEKPYDQYNKLRASRSVSGQSD
jgi:hypothetical protein